MVIASVSVNGSEGARLRATAFLPFLPLQQQFATQNNAGTTRTVPQQRSFLVGRFESAGAFSTRPHCQQISQMLALSGRHRKNLEPPSVSRVFPELRAHRYVGRALTASEIHCDN